MFITIQLLWYEICVSSGITLVSLLVPIALGIYVKKRWPHFAKKILRVGKHWNFLLLCWRSRSFLGFVVIFKCCDSFLRLLCTDRVHCRLRSHCHHSRGRWSSLPVLLDHRSLPLDYRNHLPLHWFRPGLRPGSHCRSTLVQVGWQHCHYVCV